MNQTDFLAFFTETMFLGISLANWFIALAATTLAFTAARGALALLKRRLQARGNAEDSNFRRIAAEVISGTSNALLLLACFLIGLGLLDLPERWTNRVSSLWFVVAVLQVALWAHRGLALGMASYFRRHAPAQGAQISALASLTLWGAKVLLWTVVLLAMLSNLGVNITAFVASLGVGGIAVALAVQNILGDLFASLSIAVDKPFEVGDFIVVGSLAGTVEHVGLKTTRIRSLGGEQVVMSNTGMLAATIQNYKRLQERRVVFSFRLPYDCTLEQVRQVPDIVEAAVRAQKLTRFDRAHLQAFGEHALQFEVVYIVLDPGYNVYMDIQQAINFTLMERFAEIGVRFAVPIRTIHVASVPDELQNAGGFFPPASQAADGRQPAAGNA